LSLLVSEAYEQELYSAYRLWAGSKYGNLVFTSSTVVYGDCFGYEVDEQFRTDSRSIRSARMISAEGAVLDRGGSVIRLAGLYNKDKGPHIHWLQQGTVKGFAEGTLNLLHYEDAAAVSIAVLRSPLRNQIYLASDDQPVSRKGMSYYPTCI
jgi:nucleoside-diphosphate-sugar epimerase